MPNHINVGNIDHQKIIVSTPNTLEAKRASVAVWKQKKRHDQQVTDSAKHKAMDRTACTWISCPIFQAYMSSTEYHDHRQISSLQAVLNVYAASWSSECMLQAQCLPGVVCLSTRTGYSSSFSTDSQRHSRHHDADRPSNKHPRRDVKPMKPKIE